MDEQQYLDIGDFIKGNYTDEQQTRFEQRIAEDPLYAAQVAHYISTIAVAKQVKEEKKEKLKALYHQQQVEKRAKIRTIRKWAIAISIAASLIIIVTGYFTLFQNKPDPGNMANNKNRNEPGVPAGKIPDSPGVANNTINDSAAKQQEVPKRGVSDKEQGLFARQFVADALPEDREGPLEDAFAYYETGAYKEAAVAFENADLNIKTRGPEEAHTAFFASYYKALSYMANNKAATAIPELKKAMHQSTDSLAAIKTQWYLSLAYLKTKNIKKTEELLEEIAVNRHETAYKVKAAALLKELKK